MDIATRTVDGIAIMDVIGEIDLYAAPELNSRYHELKTKHGTHHVIVNLEKTSYLDSSGIGVLFQIFTDARNRRVSFYITGVRGMVEKLLQLSRMSSILPMEATVQDALGRIRQTCEKGVVV